MPYLHITEQGATLRKTGDRLIVEKDDQQLLELECRHVEGVLLYGNVQVTTQALAEMLEHRIELALLSESGKLRGQLTPPASANVSLRLAQYARHADPPARLQLARTIVQSKLLNGAHVLRRAVHHIPNPEVTATAEILENAAKRASVAADTDTLRGIEGSAAKQLFQAYSLLFRGELPFEGRSSRPPRDPVNALLSFGYVLLGNQILWQLDAIGLDPHIGLYHEPRHGRPALALDLVEEFRHPCVDRLTLTLVNRRILTPGDFQPPDPNEGVRLTRPGLRKYLTHWERWMQYPGRHPVTGEPLTWRGAIRRQAELLARALRDNTPYQPLILRPGTESEP
ncbi:MAG: CRISPR-associated endonuclease Cas1 [Candidatus Sumerlaeaceae bacterium]|nr:CRISPR-associated endonuclease Cas1 [Candidatus Sumerlaeaceae bacterium]